MPRPPLPYRPDIERPEPREAETAAALRRRMRGIQETTFRHYGHAMRGIHTKSHGLLEGEMVVPEGLPPELAQGMFARPGRYPVVMRLSTNRGDVIDDDISVPRGMAIKVIGVEGERLPGSEGEVTQDFVMVNQPAFTEPDLRVFLRNITVVEATTDTGQAWKKGLAALLRPAVSTLRALGFRPWTLTTMGGHPATHPLGETFHTQVPFRYGEHVAKLSLAPASPALLALRGAPLDLRGRPNGLREAVIAFFREHGAEWELRVQLRTNPDTMPIENASVVWPEAESPHRTVARLIVPPQPAWSEARARQVDDGLAFSPWHGLAAHRPLGAINRARRAAYEEGARFRAERNRRQIREPRARLVLAPDPPAVFGAAPGREGRRPGTPDAPPGAWSPPMRPTARGLAIGAAAGLALVLGGALLRHAPGGAVRLALLAALLGTAAAGRLLLRPGRRALAGRRGA
ncbi:catalase family protein [Crenalkalicoccus roseus]|uniref:catalase family protein n=1 Tax=Crenalkalicoccus roseus TaxID=1485588 RepID=UPI00195C6A61|nr:catalase family protein [Crenalkalicoccus roseus]